MTEPRVPGSRPTRLNLPCGESVHVHDLDIGMRSFSCPCGDDHAVVTDAHPPSRWVPESVVETLRVTIDTADEFGEFSTVHLMGMVLEEFPEAVVSEDVSEDGAVGYALVWVTDFDARRLHEIVVELLVELMDHAVGHAEDDADVTEFETRIQEFDVEEFVRKYRRVREFEDEHDTAV